MADLHRTWLSLPLAAALMAAPASADPPLRRVVTDLRISSPQVQQALQPAARSALQKSVATSIAALARDRFGYLEWVPQPAAGADGAPLLVLEVFEEPAGPICDGAVRWRFVGEVKARPVFSGTAQDLYDGCDPNPGFKNAADFEADLTRAVKELLEKPEQRARIQSEFLRRVALVSSLETDQKRVLVPLAADQLLADRDSRLRVDFKVDQKRGEMTLRPWDPAGARMQVLLNSLVCGSIAIPCSDVASEGGEDWEPSLPGLLRSCTDLAVFMEKYVPDSAAGKTRENVRLDLGDEP